MRQTQMLALAAVFGWLALSVPGSISGQDETMRVFQPADVHRLQDVSSITVSPDGKHIAYVVRTTDTKKDKRGTDLFQVSYDGQTRSQLTFSDSSSERHPRYSPDGRYLAFLAARGGGEGSSKTPPKHRSQVWLLERSGGEARRLTELPGGVSGFEWSPNSKQLVLVSGDPDPFGLPEPEENAESEPDQEVPEDEASEENSGDKSTRKKPSKTRPPIVIDRYKFKQDGEGYLEHRYNRIYLFELESQKAVLLTPGPFHSQQPAFSPDGKWIAFSSTRPTEAEPDADRSRNSEIYRIEAREGATPEKLTGWHGGDISPVWSPDGTQIAYTQGPEPKYDFYSPYQAAVIDLETRKVTLPTEELDRAVSNLRWALDGKSLLFLFDDDRERFVGVVPAGGGKIERRSVASAGSEPRKGRIQGLELARRGPWSWPPFRRRPPRSTGSKMARR